MNNTTDSKEKELITRRMILETAVTMFATHGFKGVSMRDLAKGVGITPGALYYYFPTKEKLRVAAISYAYKDRGKSATSTLQPLNHDEAPFDRLERFVLRLSERFYEDEIFRKLVQRCTLEPNEDILDILNKEIYSQHFGNLEELLSEIAPDFDKHLLAVSIFGLVMHNYNTIAIRKSLENYKAENNRPAVLARHIVKLLKNGILPENNKRYTD